MASRLEGPFRAYRIAKAIYPILDGGGAARFPGRWNSRGRRVIYAAETYAGAMLETLVHANLDRLPKDHRLSVISIPPGMAIEALDAEDLPGWDHHAKAISRAYGDAWHEAGRNGQRPAVLLVPSFVVRQERNVLINPDHPEFPRITATAPQPVLWDARLFRG